MMDTAQVETLEARHAGLDRRIEEENARPAPDQILIAQLKKEKLKIKEAIVFGH